MKLETNVTVQKMNLQLGDIVVWEEKGNAYLVTETPEVFESKVMLLNLTGQGRKYNGTFNTLKGLEESLKSETNHTLTHYSKEQYQLLLQEGGNQ